MAERVTFVTAYDHRAKAGVMVAYPAGWSGLIPKAHADGARRRGAILDTGRSRKGAREDASNPATGAAGAAQGD